MTRVEHGEAGLSNPEGLALEVVQGCGPGPAPEPALPLGSIVGGPHVP